MLVAASARLARVCGHLNSRSQPCTLATSSADSSGDGVIVRGMLPAEREAMLQFQCRINDVPTDPDGSPEAGGYARYTQYLDGDPDRKDSDTRLLFVDGGHTIAATLRIWRRSLRIGRTVVPMGGIGGVGTAEEHQGHGYASRMSAPPLPPASSWPTSLAVAGRA